MAEEPTRCEITVGQGEVRELLGSLGDHPQLADPACRALARLDAALAGNGVDGSNLEVDDEPDI